MLSDGVQQMLSRAVVNYMPTKRYREKNRPTMSASPPSSFSWRNPLLSSEDKRPASPSFVNYGTLPATPSLSQSRQNDDSPSALRPADPSAQVQKTPTHVRMRSSLAQLSDFLSTPLNALRKRASRIRSNANLTQTPQLGFRPSGLASDSKTTVLAPEPESMGISVGTPTLPDGYLTPTPPTPGLLQSTQTIADDIATLPLPVATAAEPKRLSPGTSEFGLPIDADIAVETEVDDISSDVGSVDTNTIFDQFSDYFTNPFDPKRPRSFKELIQKRAKYYLPILKWLPDYDKQCFIADLSAGLTIGVFLIPTAIAYASLAQVSAIQGLYTAFYPLILYTAFGSSMQMSVGPEAICSTLTGNFLGAAVGDATSDAEAQAAAASWAVLLAFLVGLLLLVFGLFRLGFIESILSHSVVSGMIMAIAIEVMVQQSRTLLGISCTPPHCEPDDSTFTQFRFLLHNLDQTQWRTALIGISSVVLLFFMKYVQKRFEHIAVVKYLPTTLILVVLSIAISYCANLPSFGVAVLGLNSDGSDKDIPTGFQAPVLPDLTLDRLTSMIGPAVTITVLLFVESFVVAKTYAAKHNYPISPNRELVALGVANLFACFFGAFPAGGSLSRSKLNDNLGARTPMSGFIAGLVILCAILFVLPLFKYLPSAVIAAIVFVAVAGLIDTHDFMFMIRIRAWKDAGLFVSMIVLTLVLGIQNSIIFAFAACLALLVKNVAVVDPKLFVLGALESGNSNTQQKYVDVSQFPEAKPVEGMLMLKMQGPLHFVNIARIRDLFRRVEWFGDIFHHPSEDKDNVLSAGTCVVVDMELVPSLDTSAVHEFKQILASFQDRDISVFLAGVQRKVSVLFENSGLTTQIGKDHVFIDRTLFEAIPKIQFIMAERKRQSDAVTVGSYQAPPVFVPPIGPSVTNSTRSSELEPEDRTPLLFTPPTTEPQALD